MKLPRVSVLVPTYNQATYLPRALESVRAQHEPRWAVIVVDDCSADNTREIIRPYLDDSRFSYHRFDENQGLGAALNYALSQVKSPYVAYLPSDDVYYPDHLSSLLECIAADHDAILAYAGVRHHHHCYAEGQIEGFPLQLVQVIHRLTNDRWIERDMLITDDLNKMFWSQLWRRSRVIGTGKITCEWVDHPAQMHKAVQEGTGGLNVYRTRYQIRQPMRFHASDKDLIDEVEHYRQFRERPDTPMAGDGLKILLVGELSYNPERVLALEERGHKLYGLWTPTPAWFNTVGPLPFGHVEDVPRSDWEAAIRRLKPDLIYALLNWQAVPFAHRVLRANPGVPFVWHFKEGPFLCLEKGIWPELVDLHLRSDAQIYSSPEMRDWFEMIFPGRITHDRSLVLDGDLPKREWFTAERSRRLSEMDGEIHTVVSGRPMGIHPESVGELARVGIHTHFYGLIAGTLRGPGWQDWIERARRVAGKYLHLHPTVHQENWVSELSQYDAGWLHLFESKNLGDLRRATWDDLNYPARISTLVAAGLPLLQHDNSGSIVATQSLARRLGIGVCFSDFEHLRTQLQDRRTMTQVQDNVWRQREQFTFDHHADRLIEFFRHVVESRLNVGRSGTDARRRADRRVSLFSPEAGDE